MINSLAADLVVLLHFTFVLFVALGGFLVVKWERLAWLHLPALFWALWIEISGAICPLTPLEQSLRQKAGEASYSGSFITHYLEPILYPVGLTREDQWWIAGIALAVNLAAYLLAMRGRRLGQSRK